MAGAHLDADVAQAGVSKQSFECGVREPQVLVAEPGAHPLLIVFAQIEHQQPAAGARILTVSVSASSGSAAWCSACESSATSTDASCRGRRARSPFLPLHVGDVAAVGQRLRRSSTWSDRSMPIDGPCPARQLRASGSRRRTRCQRRRAAAGDGRAPAPMPPSSGRARAAARRHESRSFPSGAGSTSCSRASSSRTALSSAEAANCASSSAHSGACPSVAAFVGEPVVDVARLALFADEPCVLEQPQVPGDARTGRPRECPSAR